jgi:hypothetical protein
VAISTGHIACGSMVLPDSFRFCARRAQKRKDKKIKYRSAEGKTTSSISAFMEVSHIDERGMT